VEKSAGFLGSILSLTGGVMLVAHIAFVGRFVWFQGLTTGQLVRAYMAAIGVIVMIIYDRAPKVMTIAPDGPLAKLRIHRAAALAVAGAARAQTVAGDWHGALATPAGDLRAVIKIKPAAAGYDGFMLSPDQSATELPLADIKQDGQALSFAVPRVRGTYEGR